MTDTNQLTSFFTHGFSIDVNDTLPPQGKKFRWVWRICWWHL